MAKIYDFKAGLIIADIPDPIGIVEDILAGTGPLTVLQLDILDEEIGRCQGIIELCQDRDRDVLVWQETYLERICSRIEGSLRWKKLKNSK